MAVLVVRHTKQGPGRMQEHAANPLVSYAITAVVIAIVVAVRWRRMSRVVPLKLERLWIFPAIYAVVAVVLFVAFPPHGLAWVFCASALLLGGALGWQRGKLMRITIDPATHSLNQTGSPAAILFVLAIVILRSSARIAFAGGAGIAGIDAKAVTDMLIALALGLFTLQRIEMYLRAKRLLATARATPAE